MIPLPTQSNDFYARRRRPQRRQQSETLTSSASSSPPPPTPSGTGSQPQDQEPGDDNPGSSTSAPPSQTEPPPPPSSSTSSTPTPTSEPNTVTDTTTPTSTPTSSRTSSSSRTTGTTREDDTTTSITSTSSGPGSGIGSETITLGTTAVVPADANVSTDSASLTLDPGMILTSFTTEINGQQTVIVTAVPSPTSLSADQVRASERRTIAIAAGTTGAVFILSLILAALFLWKRRKNRELGFIEGLLKKKREGKGAGGVGLLDAEFDDDDDKNGVGLARYRDNPTPLTAPHNASPTPSLFRARASDTGSIFHEGVWPPPGEESRFVDPLLAKSGQDVDLTSIVDEVMGPAAAATHRKDPSSVSSTGSTTSLLGGAAPPADSGTGHLSLGSIGSLYNDPFRSNVGASPNADSVYYYRPDSQLSLNSPDTTYIPVSSSVGFTTPPSPITSPYPSSLLGLPAGAAAPKKPSPLTQNVISSPPSLSFSHDSPSLSFLTTTSPPSTPTPRNWIERSPKKGLKDLKSPSSPSPTPTPSNIGRAI